MEMNEDYKNASPDYNRGTKYCQKCGSQIDIDAVVCPHCGCSVEKQSNESSVLSYCAMIFGILGGWLGLILGIVGLISNKDAANRKRCKIGIGCFIGWVVIAIIIVIVTVAAAASAVSSIECIGLL